MRKIIYRTLQCSLLSNPPTDPHRVPARTHLARGPRSCPDLPTLNIVRPRAALRLRAHSAYNCHNSKDCICSRKCRRHRRPVPLGAALSMWIHRSAYDPVRGSTRFIAPCHVLIVPRFG